MRSKSSKKSRPKSSYAEKTTEDSSKRKKKLTKSSAFMGSTVDEGLESFMLKED
jgi:hypothetical protein